MRLRTLESFGLINNGLLHSYPSLQEKDESCQILIVGGGITGALVSFALVEQGYNVILLDKRDIACGSTAATTSLLQYEIDVPMYKLAEMIGEEPASTCYKAGIDAIGKLNALVEKYNLDCGFEKRDSLYITKNEKDEPWLKQEFEIRDKHQLGVEWLNQSQVLKDYDLNCHGAIKSTVAASVDAYKLAHSLIANSALKGMKVFDQTAMIKFEHTKNGIKLYTDTNRTISSEKIIFCTGFESTKLLKEKVAKLFNTYAIASECGIKIHDNLKKTLVWDTGSPYTYMRYTDDHRLLIGGEDSSFNLPLLQKFVRERKVSKLKNRLTNLFQEIDFIEDFYWAGKFGSTKDGLPYIGKSPEYENAYFVLGFGGNGITFSVQGMDIILDLLSGRKNELSHWYRFQR
jgi:glycine/D-amino acid oxidase-like deaminating enzyme